MYWLHVLDDTFNLAPMVCPQHATTSDQFNICDTGYDKRFAGGRNPAFLSRGKPSRTFSLFSVLFATLYYFVQCLTPRRNFESLRVSTP